VKERQGQELKKKKNVMIMVMTVKKNGDKGRRSSLRIRRCTAEPSSDCTYGLRDVAIPRDICVFGATGSANSDCECSLGGTN